MEHQTPRSAQSQAQYRRWPSMEERRGSSHQLGGSAAGELTAADQELGGNSYNCYSSGLASVLTAAGLSYCAFCQMPLHCLTEGESASQHVTRCQVTTLTVQHLLPECPAGVACASKERSHYVRFSHLALTKLRLYEASMLSSLTSDSSAPPDGLVPSRSSRSLSAVASSYLDCLQRKSREYGPAIFKTTDGGLPLRQQMSSANSTIANMYGTLTVSLGASPRHSLASTSPVMSSPMPSLASAVTTSTLTAGRISPSSVDLFPLKRARANTMSPPRRPALSRLATSTTTAAGASSSAGGPLSSLPSAAADSGDNLALRPRSGSFSVLSTSARSSHAAAGGLLTSHAPPLSPSELQQRRQQPRHGFNIVDIMRGEPREEEEPIALDLSVHSAGAAGWKSRPRSATESWVSARGAAASALARFRRAPAPAEPTAAPTGAAHSGQGAGEPGAVVPNTSSESKAEVSVSEGVDVSAGGLLAVKAAVPPEPSVPDWHPPKKRRFTSPAVQLLRHRVAPDTAAAAAVSGTHSGSAAPCRDRVSDVRDQQMAPLSRLRADSKPARCLQRKCPPFKLVADTPFAVDAFSYGLLNGVSAYFLSHFHFDHYRGLSANSVHPIVYCSQVTGNLVKNRLHVSSDRMCCLSLNEPHVIEGVQVTLLDANHCPGAVMFLFKLSSGVAHLHVGDFRADPAMESYAELWNTGIDHLYLDTTYCDPSCDFISQQESLLICERLAIAAIQKNPRTLIVCGSYFIGKERVYRALAERLNCLIWVSAEKRSILQCLNIPALTSRLTTDQMLARVHVLPLAHISLRTLQSYLHIFQSQYSHLLAFKPTSRENSTAKQTIAGNVSIYSVPYSEHSSFSELRRFVQFIQPKHVIPTIGGSSGGSSGGPGRNKHSVDDIITGWLTGDASAKGVDPAADTGTTSVTDAKTGSGTTEAATACGEDPARIDETVESADIESCDQPDKADDTERAGNGECSPSARAVTPPTAAENVSPHATSSADRQEGLQQQ